MAFTEKSIRFLKENHRKNDKAWFEAHRQDYIEHVLTPMRELAEALLPVIVQIDPRLDTDPKRTVTRIYRHTRFSHDKSLFKRASWLAFKHGKGMVGPVWFFEYTPEFYRFGCGYYSAPPVVMAKIRELVLENHAYYLKAQEALDGHPLVFLAGECYKRARYPDAHPRQRDWLERKSIAAMHTSHDLQQIFSPHLAQIIGHTFQAISPVYDFLIHADETA